MGFIVSSAGIKPDPSKIAAVINYPTPSSVKELRQFLGMANYYRKFIPNYSKVAEPLHKLTRKANSGFSWSPSCQEVFDILKESLTTPPILSYPNFDSHFILATDASATAVGAVLSQIKNDKEVVIAYWSCQLNKPERNYSTMEREALAAVAAVKAFYYYLYGFSFTLVTDHNPLISLKRIRDTSGRLARWTLFLQQFDFKVRYKPGLANGRCPDRPQPLNIIQDWGGNINIHEEQEQDTNLNEARKAIEEEKPPPGFPGQMHKLCVQDGILYRKFKPSHSSSVILQMILPTALQTLVLQQLHGIAVWQRQSEK